MLTAWHAFAIAIAILSLRLSGVVGAEIIFAVIAITSFFIVVWFRPKLRLTAAER